MQLADAVSPTWRAARARIALDRPVIIGILNVTPDSFWDGGRHAGVEAAVRHAGRLLEEGADILDIGGESTRPGAAPVSATDELNRVLPVIHAVKRAWPDAVLSVDTVKSDVAHAALDAGAAIINDVSALRSDARLAALVAHAGAGIILMHSRGAIADMARYELAEYSSDPIGDIVAELAAAMRAARAAGIDENAIIIDPGLGFAKRTTHSVDAIAALDRFASLGRPILVGPSRKRFIGELAGGLPADQRLPGTIAACVAALLLGARLFRVHDVAPVRQALAVAEAVRTAQGSA